MRQTGYFHFPILNQQVKASNGGGLFALLLVSYIDIVYCCLQYLCNLATNNNRDHLLLADWPVGLLNLFQLSHISFQNSKMFKNLMKSIRQPSCLLLPT